VIRILTMLEAMTKDEQMNIRATSGEKGIHWDYKDPKIGPSSGSSRIQARARPPRASFCSAGR